MIMIHAFEFVFADDLVNCRQRELVRGPLPLENTVVREVCMETSFASRSCMFIWMLCFLLLILFQ